MPLTPAVPGFWSLFGCLSFLQFSAPDYLCLKPVGLFLFRNSIVPPDNYSEASFRPDGGNGQCPGAVLLTLQRAVESGGQVKCRLWSVALGYGCECISSKLPVLQMLLVQGLHLEL